MNKLVNQYDLGEFRLEGKKNGHYFINRVGIGLHVDREKVSENVTIKRFMAMLHLEDMMFVISFLKVLIYYQPSSLEVSVDKDLTTYNNVWFLMISNIPTYQGRMKIATKANPTDGNLDVTIVSNISRFQLIILVFFNLVGKRYKSEAVETFVCESITVTSENSLLVHADGEIVGESPISVSVRKSRVALIK